MWLDVLLIICFIQLIIFVGLIYVCWDFGIDYMPIYYEIEYIKKESSPTIKGAAIALMIFTIPIDIYFLLFRWIVIFIFCMIDKWKRRK